MKSLAPLLSLLMLLTSCGGNATNEHLREQLIGHWGNTNASDNSVFTMTLDGDGTFKGSIKTDSKVIWEYEGKWSVEGSSFQMKYTVSSLPDIPVGTKDRDEILEISNAYFISKNYRPNSKPMKVFRLE
jgi:hypothetical protein